MIKKIKLFFEQRIRVIHAESAEEVERRLELACAVLLLEVAQADQEYSAEENQKILHAIESRFSLDQQDIMQLMANADEKSAEATDYYQFTSLINKEFSIPQKCRLVELMWSVAHADGHIDQDEDHFIRKISDLLYLRHTEMLSAKERAMKTNS